MPAGRHRRRRAVDLRLSCRAIRARPEWLSVRRHVAEAEMQFRRAFARMTVAAVDLRHSTPAVGQSHDCRRPDRRPRRRGVRQTVDDPHPGLASDRPAQRKPEEAVSVVSEIAVEYRLAPLVGDGEVEPAVAERVGDGDAARGCRLVRGLESQFVGDIDIEAIAGGDEERVVIAAAQIIAGHDPQPGRRERASNWSLAIASSCNSGQRLIAPCTNPVACRACICPELSKSSNFASHDHPARDRPSSSLGR